MTVKGVWSDEETELFKKMWAAGVKVDIIAERLGRESRSVRHKRSNLCLKPRVGAGRIEASPTIKWTEEEDEVLTRMWLDGENYQQIAEKLGRNLRHVRDRRCRLQLPRREGTGTKTPRHVELEKFRTPDAIFDTLRREAGPYYENTVDKLMELEGV